MFSKWIGRALHNIENGLREIEEWSNPDTGVITLSYLNILGVELIPSLIRSYQLEISQSSVRIDTRELRRY